MRNRAVAVVFDAWHADVAATLSARRETLRRVGNRLANKTLSLAFERWRAQVAEQKEQIARARQLAARMLHELTGKCFDGWMRFANEQRRILRRAAFAIGPGRVLYLTFNTWAEAMREAVAEREHANMIGTIDARLAANIEAYLENKGLTLAALTSTIETLESNVAKLPSELDERMAEARLLEERYLERRKTEMERRQKAEDDRLKREEIRKRDLKMGQVMKQWRNRLLYNIFDGWAGIVRNTKEMVKRAANTWRNIGLSKGWRKWISVWQKVSDQVGH